MSKQTDASITPPVPASKVIGPFLGLGDAGTVRIFVGLPDAKEIKALHCRLSGAGAPVAIPGPAPTEHFRLFQFTASNLVAGARYTYTFTHDGTTLDLDGIDASDCEFVAPHAFGADDSFVLMSCHGPFQEKRADPEDAPWDMWVRLLATLKQDSSIKLLVLGGDQVYNDCVEEANLDGATYKKAGDRNLVRDFITNYQRYWGNAAYRRVMARIPSVAMWDDHDITDGWGGRLESFAEVGFNRPWKQYFNVARQAFAEYQAVRNPPVIPGVGQLAFTTCLDLGTTRLYMLDFRSEKDTRKGHGRKLWSEAHETAFIESLLQTPEHIKRVLVVSPVVAFRTSFSGDARLQWGARFLFNLNRWAEERTVLARVWRWSALALTLGPIVLAWSVDSISAYFLWLLLLVIGTAGGIGYLVAFKLGKIPELPHLTDDLEDGLSADGNRPTLVKLLRALFDWKRMRRGTVAILSGDIHLAGVTEVVDMKDGSTQVLPQIVSSPISYPPCRNQPRGSRRPRPKWCSPTTATAGCSLATSSTRHGATSRRSSRAVSTCPVLLLFSSILSGTPCRS